MYPTILRSLLFATLLAGSLVSPAIAREPVLADLVASVKANMAESQVVLRQYEWIETTVITLDGYDSLPKRKGCYYDAGGELRKEPLSAQTGRRFQRDMIPPDEGEQLTGYVQEAVKLLHQYIPLNLSGVQAAKLDGGLVLKVTEPGKRALLTISNFLLKGDRLVLDLDLATNRPLSLKIDSYLDTQKEPIIQTVTFGSLYGTATFARETVLEAKGKKLRITIRNTDYNKTAP